MILGLAAYELGMALIWKVDLDNNRINPRSKEILDEARDLLAKAADILSYEPPGTNHGLLGQSAKNELAKL